jgi:tape measure domain-containing protein
MGFGDSTIGLLFRIKSDPTQAVQGLKQTGQEVNKLDKQTKDFGQTSTGVGSIFAGSFLANFATGVVTTFVSELTTATKAVFDYSARMEQTKIGFATLLGGTEAAVKHIKDLKTFAETTPFEFEGLANMSRRLQNAGVEAEKVLPLMTDIGNAAAAVGASSEEINSISLAFSQIIAKGKVSAEEVNQLAERGIPIWQVLSKELGRSKAEIIDLAEKGKISSDIFLEAFHRFSQANFGDAMEKQSHTFNGAFSTIKDIILDAAANGFQTIFEKIASFTDDVAISLSKQKREAGEVGLSFGQIVGTAMGVGFRQAFEDSINSWNSSDKSWWQKAGSIAAAPGGWAYEWGKQVAKGAGEGFQHQSTQSIGQGQQNFVLDPSKGFTLQPAPAAAASDLPPIDLKAIEDSKKARDEILKKQRDGELGQLAALQKAEEHVLERVTDALRKQLAARAISSKQFLEQRLLDEEEFAKASLAHIDDEFELKKKQSGLEAEQLLAIEMENNNERQRIVDERLKREEDAKKEAAEADKKLTEEQITTAREAMDRTIDLRQAALGKMYAQALELAANEKFTAEQVAKFKEKLDLDLIAFRIRLLKQYGELLDKNSKEYLDVQNRIKILEHQLEEQRATNAVNDKKRHKDRIESWREYIRAVERAKEAEDELQQRRAEEEEKRRKEQEQKDFEGIGGGVLGGIFGELGFSVEEMLKPVNVLNEVGQVLAQTFEQVASAVGSAVRSFVLFGSAGGSFRKFAAEIIASLAATAAVQALYELAQGFAMLALGWFTNNPKYYKSATDHFISAAVFGTIAGVAAVAGRAIAGDAFSRDGGGGSASDSGSGSSRSSRDPAAQGLGYSSFGEDAYIQEEGRNAPLGVAVEISFKDKPDWFDDVFEARWSANGKPRRIIEDGR